MPELPRKWTSSSFRLFSVPKSLYSVFFGKTVWVCLKQPPQTSKRIWRFQSVHHDVADGLQNLRQLSESSLLSKKNRRLAIGISTSRFYLHKSLTIVYQKLIQVQILVKQVWFPQFFVQKNGSVTKTKLQKWKLTVSALKRYRSEFPPPNRLREQWFWKLKYESENGRLSAKCVEIRPAGFLHWLHFRDVALIAHFQIQPFIFKTTVL